MRDDAAAQPAHQARSQKCGLGGSSAKGTRMEAPKAQTGMGLGNVYPLRPFPGKFLYFLLQIGIF